MYYRVYCRLLGCLGLYKINFVKTESSITYNLVPNQLPFFPLVSTNYTPEQASKPF